MQSVSHLFMPHQPRLRMEVLGYCRGSAIPICRCGHARCCWFGAIGTRIWCKTTDRW